MEKPVVSIGFVSFYCPKKKHWEEDSKFLEEYQVPKCFMGVIPILQEKEAPPNPPSRSGVFQVVLRSRTMDTMGLPRASTGQAGLHTKGLFFLWGKKNPATCLKAIF